MKAIEVLLEESFDYRTRLNDLRTSATDVIKNVQIVPISCKKTLDNGLPNPNYNPIDCEQTTGMYAAGAATLATPVYNEYGPSNYK